MRKINQKQEKFLRNQEYSDRFKKKYTKEERRKARKEKAELKDKEWIKIHYSGYSWLKN